MEVRNELTYTGQEVQDILDNSLLKKSQFLTDAEKQQVKNNLGIKDTDLSGYATKEEMSEVEDKVSMSLEVAESAQEIAINAKNQSSEALRQAQVSTDAISTLKGLENSDEAMAIIAQEITKIAQNSSDIAALKSLIQVMSRKEYDAIEEKDQNVIYMIY